jgi:hypothetical protein
MGRVSRRKQQVTEFNDFDSPMWVAPEIDNSVELTLYKAIEQIVDVVRNSQLNSEIYNAAARPIAYITNRLSISELQAIVFAVTISMYYDSRIQLTDIARCLDITPLAAIPLMNDIDELCKLRYLQSKQDDGTTIYWVPSATLKAVQRNDEICTNHSKVDNTEAWFAKLDLLLMERNNGEKTYDIFCNDVKFLLQDNPELLFVQQFKVLCNELREDHQMLFLLCCNMLVTDSVQQITSGCFRTLFQAFECRNHSVALSNGSHPLIKLGLLQVANCDGTCVKDTYELTPMVIKEMLSEVEVTYKQIKPKGVIRHSSIVKKEMFYNPKEQQQIDQLTNLLQREHLSQVREKLRERGLRSGFTCLFYGAPGTGKTETVLQLARMTKRNIIEVNVDEIKSKWVGESEKNIRDIFVNYRKAVKSSKTVPILFFNEADAIFGKRLEDITRSVDKMENSMQNIILEEMETLDGILIATTNLTCNFDKAFERRFLYKIEFSKPSIEAKSSIWQSMIPELNDEDASMLAERYDFSGGQIENVARKNVVDAILMGEELSFDTIIRHCDSELLGGNRTRNRIGF